MDSRLRGKDNDAETMTEAAFKCGEYLPLRIIMSQIMLPDDHPLTHTAQRLVQASDYAARHIKSLQCLLTEDNCQRPLTHTDYQQLVAQIPLDISSIAFACALRQFRHRHLLRLLLRELSNLSTTYNTMEAWSDCADAIILRALHYCEQQTRQQVGEPYHDSGEAAQLYVCAMGKLGGRELNYSSDIDLIFAFSAAGHTHSAASISNEQYYSKVVQQFMQLLQTITVDGFVFRVDLRLRPFGESGPLVCTLAAMETYYQEQGRDWERYAMVKARLIGADVENQHWFNRLIKPFVYRRYIDFSVIESLRSMKAMIEREIKLNPMLDDIKRGKGGIREVEFIIQSFQLIRGGRLPRIQQQNAMAALHALKKERLLSHTAALQHAYLFLRKLENALQSQNDQQTHALPANTMIQRQILILMNFDCWDDLLAKLHQYQRIVNLAFYAVLSKVDDYEDEKRVLNHQLVNVWQGHVETAMAVNLLTSLGFHQAERCYQLIHAFRHAPRCRRLTQVAQIRLDHFMVVLLSALTQVNETDVVLLQVLHLLENIVGRSAYLALLTENPPALQELLHWFAHSPFITSLFVTQPFLLEVLIDQEQSWRPLSRHQLEQQLQVLLAPCEERELEDEVLRQFKLTCWLLAARAELYGQYDAIRIGRFLADVAETIIAEVLRRACQQLKARYPEFTYIMHRFAIIAYGKLGSREMNYDSDVDLVFLHSAEPADETLVIRLTQKILRMLTTRSQAGLLYSVDTRLRPSGTAGLLVSHIDAFVEYQRTQAWTWEHQALLKARVIFANKSNKLKFNQLKRDVLCLPRAIDVLRDDVQSMRAKINKHLDHNAIKHVAGGLLDLEFLVQFLVLAYPRPGLVRTTNTLAQLQKLYNQSTLTKAQFVGLKRAYRHYHRLLHQHLLQPVSSGEMAIQTDVVVISEALYTKNSPYKS